MEILARVGVTVEDRNLKILNIDENIKYGMEWTNRQKVVAHFAKKNDVLITGRTSGDVTVDIADSR